MHITVVSSLDLFCRSRALDVIVAGQANALMVLHDLGEDGVVVRRLFRDGVLSERESTPLDHGCLSCAVRLDVVPTVERLLSYDYEHIVLGLPPGVEASMAVNALGNDIQRPFTVDTIVLACDAATIEDQIWDRHTLFESGFTPTRSDERTPGEFLLGELAFSDTVLMANTDVLVPATVQTRERGALLVGELAPHAVVAEDRGAAQLGRHDGVEAYSRTTPGSVQIPASAANAPFNTVLQRVERPLHPERFRQALPALAAGNVWLRGRLWIAAAPQCRVAIEGIGPRVWLDGTHTWLADQGLGPAMNPIQDTEALLNWHPIHGDRGTVIAITGEGVDADEVTELLTGCELSEEEMKDGFAHLNDPFALNTNHS